MDEERKLTPITCEIINRQPTMEEMRYSMDDVLEARIDFHFWDGHEWIEYGCGNILRITKVVSANIEYHKDRNEMRCWDWFNKMMRKGVICCGEPGEEEYHPVLAIARYPIIVTEE